MRYVTYSVGEGLCNRLRIHLIAHAYALHAKATFVLDWPTVQAFGARYEDLFFFDQWHGVGQQRLRTSGPAVIEAKEN